SGTIGLLKSGSWKHWHQFEPELLRAAEHEIHVLDGLASGTFAEVVQGTESDDRLGLGIGGVGHEGQVRALRPLRMWRAVTDADDSGFGVKLAGGAQRVLGRE